MGKIPSKTLSRRRMSSFRPKFVGSANILIPAEELWTPLNSSDMIRVSEMSLVRGFTDSSEAILVDLDEIFGDETISVSSPIGTLSEAWRSELLSTKEYIVESLEERISALERITERYSEANRVMGSWSSWDDYLPLDLIIPPRNQKK